MKKKKSKSLKTISRKTIYELLKLNSFMEQKIGYLKLSKRNLMHFMKRLIQQRGLDLQKQFKNMLHLVQIQIMNLRLMVKKYQGGSLFNSWISYLPWTKKEIQDILFHLMIEFKGTSEKDWLETNASSVKTIYKKLREYLKSKKTQCPFL